MRRPVAAGDVSAIGGDRSGEVAQEQREPSDDVAAVCSYRLVPQPVQGVEVNLALFERLCVQPGFGHSPAPHGVGAGPQQVSEQGVFTGPCEFALEQFVAETTVVQVEAPAVLVAVPYPGTEEDGVSGLHVLTACERLVRS